MNKSVHQLGVYALHPIMYQTPIFTELHKETEKCNLDVTVLFGDDLSLRTVFYEETNVAFKPDTPFLLDGYQYKFLKNYALDSRGGFFSRVNFGMLKEIFSRRYDAMLVHGFDRFTSFLIIFAAKLTNTKLIWRGENIIKPKHKKSGFKGAVKYHFIKTLFKLFDAVMYSCTGNKRYLEYYKVNESKMFSIPCAVNNTFFRERCSALESSRSELRNKYGIGDDDFVIIFSARFTERKRPYDLIDAVKKLNNENIVILFVGDGPEKDEMQKQVNEAGIRSVFTGFVNQSEISNFYMMADVGTVISREDPSPKAMNEMMNFSIPIIVTDCVGTAPDLVIDGRNGFVMSVGDTKLLSEKIDILYSDTALREKMGSESLVIVSEWNYKKDVDGILSAYQYVTGTSLSYANA